MVLKGYLLSILYALICLGLGMFAYKLGAPKKITRKIVHILVGFEWVILYRFMGGGVHFLAVCLIFLAILTVSHFKGLMPMISSDGDNSPGTVYYAVAMSIMSLITLFLPDMIIPFGIGVFCTSFGDGLAGLVGQSVTSPFNKKIYGNKTIIGAVVNLVTCFLTAFVFSKVFNLPLGILYCIFIAIFALELELFCGMGLDNIAITLGSSLLSYFLIGYAETPSYILPILLTPLMIAFASKKKALTKSGIIAAIVVDLLISVSLGNFGFLVLLAFFVCGVGVDKIKKHSKKAGQSEKNTFEKRGDCRDYVQVFANSLVASICAFAYLLSANRLFIIAFVASLAEALADTVASGIGSLSGRAFDIFRMRPSTPGLSGGMSLLGTLASVVGAVLIALLAFGLSFISAYEMMLITLAAFLGGVFDSFLGSILQVKYRCPKCYMIVEREEHCSVKTEKYSGLSFVTNDLVNLLGTAFSALLASVACIAFS